MRRPKVPIELKRIIISARVTPAGRDTLFRVGDGNITFWSVMPYSKFKQGQQKVFTEGIEYE